MQQKPDSQDRTGAENIKHGKDRAGKKPPKGITEKYLHNAGLAYLERFPTSIAHFRRVMMRKIDRSCNYHKEQDRGDCLTLLEKAVENFSRMGLLNDNLYLQGMATSLRRRGLSKQAILAKLAQKGMTQADILAAIGDYDEQNGAQNPELSAAVLLCRRKRLAAFQTAQAKDGDKNRALATLARAGFSYDIAAQALSLNKDDALEIINEGKV